MRRLNRRRGFTLIEALAAFAIFTLVMSQLLSGVSGAARNETRADFLMRAARHGGAKLEALGADGVMPVGVTEGRFDDGLLWRLAVEEADSVQTPGSTQTTTGYRVALVIRRPDGDGQFDLTSYKLVSVGQSAQLGGFGAR